MRVEEKLNFDATIHHFSNLLMETKRLHCMKKGIKKVVRLGILKIKLPTNDMKTFPLKTF